MLGQVPCLGVYDTRGGNSYASEIRTEVKSSGSLLFAAKSKTLFILKDVAQFPKPVLKFASSGDGFVRVCETLLTSTWYEKNACVFLEYQILILRYNSAYLRNEQAFNGYRMSYKTCTAMVAEIARVLFLVAFDLCPFGYGSNFDRLRHCLQGMLHTTACFTLCAFFWAFVQFFLLAKLKRSGFFLFQV